MQKNNHRIILLLKNGYKRFKEESFITFLYRIIKFLLINYIIIKDSLNARLIRLLSRKKYFIRNILGSKMYLDIKQDSGISYELFKYHIREAFIVKELLKIVKKGYIVIDIGANIGYYTLLESKLAGPTGQIYAIEPVPKNVQLLKRNIQLNQYTNIKIYNLAIGDKNKKGKIYISQKCNWSSLVNNSSISPTIIGETDVSIVTLDKFLEHKPWPNLIRMDVEGYELNILRGMKNILKSEKPLQLMIEVHSNFLGKNNTMQLFSILQNANFHIKAFTYEQIPCLINIKSRLVRKILKRIEKRIKNPYGYYKNISIKKILAGRCDLINKQNVVEIIFERK